MKRAVGCLPLLFLSAAMLWHTRFPQAMMDYPYSTVEKVRLVAGSVLRATAFRFVDEKNGAIYMSTAAEAPAAAQPRPESPYNDWRYWNGVLNIAMLGLADELHDTSYSGSVVRCVAFDFDNFLSMRKRR